MIRAADVVKVYGTGGSAVRVLDGVTFAAGAGERIAVLGRSGSGKSTLLHLLGGLDAPTAGHITINGMDLHSMNARGRADYRLRAVGIVFQSFHLVPTWTAVRNVELPLVFAGVPLAERRRAASVALGAVGLGHRLTHRPAELSGGERQRVAVARALINTPRVVLADEPTGNLDTATAREVMDLLLEHVRADGKTLILVTHDEELAARAADRVVRMADGRLMESTA